jgi:hypothetical protein
MFTLRSVTIRQCNTVREMTEDGAKSNNPLLEVVEGSEGVAWPACQVAALYSLISLLYILYGLLRLCLTYSTKVTNWYVRFNPVWLVLGKESRNVKFLTFVIPYYQAFLYFYAMNICFISSLSVVRYRLKLIYGFVVSYLMCVVWL